MSETVQGTNAALPLGSYKELNKHLLPGGITHRDHVPSFASIRKYADLRFGLDIPDHKAISYDRFGDWAKQLYANSQCWVISKEDHVLHSRTNKSSNEFTYRDDMQAFKRYLLKEKAIPAARTLDDISDEEAQSLMRRFDNPAQKDYGREYLRIAIRADVSELRAALKDRGIRDADINAAQQHFMDAVEDLDHVLARQAEVRRQHDFHMARLDQTIDGYVPPASSRPGKMVERVNPATGEIEHIEMPPMRAQGPGFVAGANPRLKVSDAQSLDVQPVITQAGKIAAQDQLPSNTPHVTSK